jgi:hypothetical protein
MLTGNFNSDGNLYGVEHILTMIARGFIFGNFYEADKLYNDGIIDYKLIITVKRVLFGWLGFWCANDYSAEDDSLNKWNKKYPQADGWLKKYYMKNCTKNDKEKRWGKIEKKWSASLQGYDYKFSVVSINDIIANALELGALKEQCMIVKKDSVAVKSAKLTERFKYLYCVDEKKGANPQERTVERFLKNIAAYLYFKRNHPENQKYVLLNRIQLLCWYGLDDYKNARKSWYFPQFVFGKGENAESIMTAVSSERGWEFIKLMIDNDFISKFDIHLIDVNEMDAVDREKYWIIKDNGHGEGSLKCVE